MSSKILLYDLSDKEFELIQEPKEEDVCNSDIYSDILINEENDFESREINVAELIQNKILFLLKSLVKKEKLILKWGPSRKRNVGESQISFNSAITIRSFGKGFQIF